MLDLGFDKLSMEPVVGPADDPSSLTDEDLPIVLGSMKSWRSSCAGVCGKRPAVHVFTTICSTSRAGPAYTKRISGCGSGTEYMAVTPWGDLYPCHQFVGEEQFRLGDVWKGVTNPEAQAQFAACNVRPARMRGLLGKALLSGGCAANAYHATGSVRGVYGYGCELFRKRMECAIMLEAAKALDGEEA